MTKKRVQIISVASLLVLVVALIAFFNTKPAYSGDVVKNALITFHKAGAMPSDSKVDTALNVVGSMEDGNYENAMKNYCDYLKKKTSPEQLKQAWSQVTAMYGPLTEVSDITSGRVNRANTVSFTCKYKRGTLWCICALDDSNNILMFGMCQSAEQRAALARKLR